MKVAEQIEILERIARDEQTNATPLRREAARLSSA